MKMNKFKSNLFVILGLFTIVLSIVYCGSFSIGENVEFNIYGGDAFTGIQNASAMAARNIKYLANIVKFGFSSVLFISGLTLIVVSIVIRPDRKDIEDTIDYNDNNEVND